MCVLWQDSDIVCADESPMFPASSPCPEDVPIMSINRLPYPFAIAKIRAFYALTQFLDRIYTEGSPSPGEWASQIAPVNPAAIERIIKLTTDDVPHDIRRLVYPDDMLTRLLAFLRPRS